MQLNFDKYIYSISSKFLHKATTEFGYRTHLENLLEEIFQDISVKRIGHDDKTIDGNKPDFVLLKYDIPILYIEAKDIGISLDKVELSEQMSRYYGYTNLVLTDYLEFRFYRNGLKYDEPIRIANYDLSSRTVNPVPENYEYLVNTFNDFIKSHKEPIRSGEHLAKIMGGKAQRIRDNVRQFFKKRSVREEELVRLYETFKKLLVHDLTEDKFADMYAQTLVYGLFAARYHDKTSSSFTRQEARELIPRSNPLLRHFFDHIIGPNFDKRLEYIVNELCEVFSHADINELMREYYKLDLFGEEYKDKDPVIHFYEDFLKEYDPVLRKKMGAYYTPPAVVHFMVQSVDDLLKKEFDLLGLVDTTKLESGIHKVQILDPAVGTGTFISAIIRTIYADLLNIGQKGRWLSYVQNDLLPRLYGFELMMAPYTIAHLKLGIAFSQTGFNYFNRRLGIYLTNSLENSIVQTELFTAFGLAESIAKESEEAAVIKTKTPIMVVIGNPPYSGESANASYIENDVYKKESTGEKLKEKNSKWVNDDYVKFIRFAEMMIEKSGEGIVAMITAHGYLDNPTFRGMRFHLMKTFNEIYVFDLHGNANKKEVAPDGSPDKNVFDIKQGVSIFIGVKKSDKKTGKLSDIYRSDLYGSREKKFQYLSTNSYKTTKWNKITASTPNFEWVNRDEKIREQYNEGFSVTDLFKEFNVGIVTARDSMTIQFNRKDIEKVLEDFQRLDIETLRAKYSLGKDAQDWKVSLAKKDVIENYSEDKIIPINYRPFDIRWTFYSGNSKGFHCRPREKLMIQMFNNKNVSLITCRLNRQQSLGYFFISKLITDFHILDSAGDSTFQFPLYLFTDNGTKIPNLHKKIVSEIEKINDEVTPEDILDYIYAIFYSPNYRERYKEFLKIDFPRVPYPRNKKSFIKLISLGKELRLLHLLESPKLNQFITTYPEEGTDAVENVIFKSNSIFINNKQFFGNVPESVWNFYIGGYRPIQKWLKDRKGLILSNFEIEYFQKIIVAINDTNYVIQEIDKVIEEI